MRWYTGLLFFGLFLVQRSFCSNNDHVQGPKIAIIGAGIGGAATAHFLTELFDRNLEIDIFEKDRIGGRLATVPLGSSLYEAGGAVIHPRNKYMKDFVKLLRLEELRKSAEGMDFGIWNGDEFVYKGQNANSMVNVYGEGHITKLFRTVNSFLDNFDNIYDAQDNGLAYENVNDLISAMNPNFPKLLQVSAADYFSSLGLSNRIIDELIEATLLENYGQHKNVHSFVSLVSVAGAAATAEGGLWSVKGGNENVPQRLINTNPRVEVKFLKVKKIRHSLNEEFENQFEIGFEHDTDSSGNIVMKNIYDIVVIAAPLPADERWSIDFDGFSDGFKIDGDPAFRVNYQTTVATLFVGDMNLRHFCLNETIDAILMSDRNKVVMNSISSQLPVNGSDRNYSAVWKVFSEKPLTKFEEIRSMFSRVEEVQEVSWKAYPKYSVNPRKDKFELYDSLYHVNAIEWAASAMEMSVIGARNVALLIHKKLASCCQNSSAMRRKRCKYSCEGKNFPRGTRSVEL